MHALNTDMKTVCIQDAEFRDYNNKLNHVQAREVNRRDYLFEREQRALKESAFDNSNQEKYLRKLHQQSAYQDIKEQVIFKSN